jgi:hypothetical protein
MRSALFVAAAIAMAMSGHALAASQPSTGASPPDTASPPSTSGSTADTSATAGAPAAAALSVGEPVKDNTGATIGAISSISASANGQQMAVIKMGNDTFQAPVDRLGVANGAATINLSQSQIAGMIHPAAGGR